MNFKKRTNIFSTLCLATVLSVFGGAASAQGSAERSSNNNGDEQRQAQPVNPNGIVVDDNGACPGTDFTTIQAAINASPAGSTIQVCPGVYREQIRIAKRITLVGVEFNNQGQARIQPQTVAANTTSLFDNSPIAALVVVDNANRVTLENLTVDGASNTLGCSPTLVGIFYRNASGTIESAAVRNIVANNTPGCGNATAIFAQSGGSGGRTNLTVSNSSVHDYDKNGIIGNEIGTTLNATGNAVSGRGSVQDTAQNGIQIAFGASGQIEDNAIINNVYAACVSPANCPTAATNILVFQSNDVRVRNNTAGNSNANILAAGDRNDINQNTILDSNVFDGIVLVGNGNDARANRIFNSDRAGITVEGNQNRVRNNFVNEAQNGVLITGGSNNNIGNNNGFFNVVNTTTTATSGARVAAAQVNASPVRF